MATAKTLPLHGIDVPAHKWEALRGIESIVYGRTPHNEPEEVCHKWATERAIQIDKTLDRMVFARWAKTVR